MSSLMVEDKRINTTPVVSSKYATIAFIRPSFHGHLLDAGIFALTDEGEDFVGKVGYQEGVAISVKPGEHMFMSVDENINFPRLMKAQVEAGRTYYVVVSPNGWPVIIFSLVPVKKDKGFKFNHANLSDWLASTDWVRKTSKADEWFNTVKHKVHDARIGAYNDWMSSGRDVDPQLLMNKKDAYLH
jgi:hypothetical protein